MGKAFCDGCGRKVTVAGGVANLWTFGERDGSDGTALTLDLEDGTTHLLCYPCIEKLPDNPTEDDVEALEAYDASTDSA